MAREFATTCQAILHHATEHPHDDAIIDRGTIVSYLKLAQSIVQFTAALLELGIAPGELVVAQGQNRLVHWLILFACERIGAPSATLPPGQFHDGDVLVGRAAWIIADTEIPPAPGRRCHCITPEWVSAAFRRPVSEAALAELAAAPDPASVLRYTLTSGTTGEPKLLRLTGAQFVRHSLGKTRDCPLDRYQHPRFLCAYSFAVRAAHTRATGCLHLGGTVIFTEQNTVLSDLSRYRPHCAAMLTGTVAAVMRSLPADYPKPEALALSTTGAPLGGTLRAEILRRLASEVIDLYALSEASSVAIVGADGVGDVLPNTEVAIIDESGAPVPDGTAGLIKVRNDTMLDGYIDDPEATARHFRDGWFITNDVGVVPAPGRLRVLGRHDDMLNLGGIKLLPFPIEDRLRRIDGVREAIVLGYGDDALGALVELTAGTRLDPLLPDIMSALTAFWRPVSVRAIEAIPWTRGNKPDRRAAAALFR
jgi:long-chain acyl-CoA synthetase